MSIEQTIKELKKDMEMLKSSYENRLPIYEFGYIGIGYLVKILMDSAPRHGVALETIKVATEEGIKWHVEERAEQTKNEEKNLKKRGLNNGMV